jgi:adenine phosphoribosyltransferase
MSLKVGYESVLWLASGSKHKIEGLKTLFEESDFGFEPEIVPVKVDVPGNPNQPLGSRVTLECAMRRLEALGRKAASTEKRPEKRPTHLVAIENGIVQVELDGMYDICVVIVFQVSTSTFFVNPGTLAVPLPFCFMHLVGDLEPYAVDDPHSRPIGYEKTFGEALGAHMESEEPDVVLYKTCLAGKLPYDRTTYDPANWMESFSTMSRLQQVVEACMGVQQITTFQLRACLRTLISYVENFPREGVTFANLMPLFSSPYFSASWISLMTCYVDCESVTAVMGPEFRGSLMALQVAGRYGVPFIPLRKPGKLPPPVLTESFTKEYGEDALSIPEGSVNEHSKVLILDDVLATGGTLAAAGSLVRKAGGEVVAMVTMVDVTALREEASKNLEGFKVVVLI